MITLEDGNLDGYGCNQIIVLIVLIVTGCLNESMPFSLFNAMQILHAEKRNRPSVLSVRNIKL